MKKIIFSVAVALVVSGAALGGYAYYQQSQIDPAILANIQALSQYEGDGEPANPIKDCYDKIHYDVGAVVIWCYTCMPKWDYDDDLWCFSTKCRVY